MLTCNGVLDPPFRAFSRRAWNSWAQPVPRAMEINGGGDGIGRGGGSQVSILDSLGVAAPVVLVLVGTSIPLSQPHRHLGACPCQRREDSVPQKNRGVGLMPAIRLRSGERG